MTSVLPTWTTVGFTGHRKLDRPETVATAIRDVLNELEASYRPLAAVSSAASGADTLFVEEVARRKLPFFIILPFAEERFKQDFSADDWNRIAAHFGAALALEVVRDVDSPQEGYLDGGVLTVDRADVVIAVWNGQGAAGEGGTGDVVEYARALGKPLIWIDSANGLVTKERLDLLPQQDSTTTADVDPGGPSRELVVRQYAQLDATAEQHAPRARRLILHIIWLHLVAAALGITGGAFEHYASLQSVFTLLKFATLGLALYLTFRQRQIHYEWRGARIAAEICRSFLAIWQMRRRGARIVAPATDEHAVLVRSLEMIWHLDRVAERPLHEARDQYVKGRIHDQVDYFTRKYKTGGQRTAKLKIVARTATVIAFVCSGLALGMSLADFSGLTYKFVKSFSSLLSLIPPAILSLVVALDLARRAERFGDVTAKLQSAERRVSVARTWPGLWRAVSATEDLLIGEVVEWYSATRPRRSF